MSGQIDIRAVIGVLAVVATGGITLLCRAGGHSARTINEVTALEAGRLRAKVEAYELLHGTTEE